MDAEASQEISVVANHLHILGPLEIQITRLQHPLSKEAHQIINSFLASILLALSVISILIWNQV